jgi:hypothetical protein
MKCFRFLNERVVVVLFYSCLLQVKHGTRLFEICYLTFEICSKLRRVFSMVSLRQVFASVPFQIAWAGPSGCF